MPDVKENLKKPMDITNVDQSENKVEIILNNEPVSTTLSFLETNSIPVESQNIQTDYKLKNKILTQLEIKDFYQYDIERKKLDLEDKKNNHDRIERIFRFLIIIAFIIFLLILSCSFFLVLIY